MIWLGTISSQVELHADQELLFWSIFSHKKIISNLFML
jgi:hypothetical protein